MYAGKSPRNQLQGAFSFVASLRNGSRDRVTVCGCRTCNLRPRWRLTEAEGISDPFEQSVGGTVTENAPMTRTWPALLMLWIYSSSASGTSSARRAVVLGPDPLDGCYQMVRAAPSSPGADSRFPMPPPFRLDSILGTGDFNCAKTRVLWASPPQTYFALPISWTRVGPDSITIVWSNGFGGLVAQLRIDGDTLRGTATTFSDMKTGAPDPFTPVVVARIPCPLPSTDSAAVAANPPPGTKRTALTTTADWDSLPVGDTTRIFLRDSAAWINQLSRTEIRWYVSDTTVATVDSSGLLRGRTIGRTTVIARAPHGIAEHDLSVVSLHLTQINSGIGETCGVTQGGDAVCWGGWPPEGIPEGQLPTHLAGTPRLTTISVGFMSFCGLDSTGSPYCGGKNSSGQLGLGYANSYLGGNTVKAAGRPPLSLITTGADYTCGIATDATAYCWGSNSYGQLGTSTALSERCEAFVRSGPCSSTPIQVSPRLHFRDLAAGYQHTCGVLTDASIVCWGDNSDGQLGNGSHQSSATPVRVVSNAHFSSVTVGGTHTCAVTTDGHAYCWGSNKLGELGVGKGDGDRAVPTPIDGSARFRSLSATGDSDTCGLTLAGAILCWGLSEADGVSPLHATDTCTKMQGDPLPCARRPVPQGDGDHFVWLGRSLGGAMCALDAQGRPFCWGGSWSVGNRYACGEPTPPVLVGGGPSALWMRQSTASPPDP